MTEKSLVLFDKPGMHIHRGVFYLPFMPPWLIGEVEDLKMSPDDVLFGTYPRSGTPFLSEILWLIFNDANVEEARKTPHGERVRFMEHLVGDFNPVEFLKTQPSPRLLKSHLPASFFKAQIEDTLVRAITMIRNPKDMLVSLFRFYKAEKGYVQFKGSWNDFFALFKAKQLFGGDWFDHVLSWNSYKDYSNVLILDYENIREKPLMHVKKIAEHCGFDLASDKLEVISEYVMKEVPEESIIGEWKQFLSTEQAEYVDHLYQKKIKPTGLIIDGININ